jgi:hypothetical protein
VKEQVTVRISQAVVARLRQTAAVRGVRIGAVVEESLDGALPGPADIAAMITNQAEETANA